MQHIHVRLSVPIFAIAIKYFTLATTQHIYPYKILPLHPSNSSPTHTIKKEQIHERVNVPIFIDASEPSI